MPELNETTPTATNSSIGTFHLATTSGHFYLLTTSPDCPQHGRSSRLGTSCGFLGYVDFCAFVSNVGHQGNSGCITVQEYHPRDLRTRCQSIMNESLNASANQRQIDSRENLFFFLRTLYTQAHGTGSKELLDSSIADDQVEAYVSRNGMP